MAFNNSFTGKGTGILLPETKSVQTLRDSSNLLRQGAELKYKKFKEDENFYLKMMEVDPASAISAKAMDEQSRLIDNFNNSYGKLFAQKGKLDVDDKSDMLKARLYIEAKGNEIRAMQKGWEIEHALVTKDPLNYDQDEHARKTAEFLSTGKFDYNSLPIRPKDFASYIRSESQKVKNDAFTEWKPAGGGYEELVIGNVPKGKEGDYIEEWFHKAPEGEKLGVFKDLYAWKEANPDAYLKLFDTDQSGTVDDKEAKSPNAIMQWMKTNPKYLSEVTTYDRRLNQRRQVSSGAKSNGNMRTWYGGGKQLYTPTSAQESPFPSLPSSDYHPFNNLNKAITIPVSKMELLEPDKATSVEEKPQQSIKGYVTGYDENSDKITFLISQDYKDLDFPSLSSGRGMQIAVPRSAFSKETFDDLEIVKDGKNIKLKDLVRTKEESTYTPDYLLRGGKDKKGEFDNL